MCLDALHCYKRSFPYNECVVPRGVCTCTTTATYSSTTAASASAATQPAASTTAFSAACLLRCRIIPSLHIRRSRRRCILNCRLRFILRGLRFAFRRRAASSSILYLAASATFAYSTAALAAGPTPPP